MKKIWASIYGTPCTSYPVKVFANHLPSSVILLWCNLVLLFFSSGVLLGQELQYQMRDTTQGRLLLDEAVIAIASARYDEALGKLDTAGIIFEQTLGKEDTSYAKVLNQKGRYYHFKGEYDRAIDYYQKALDIRLSKLGSDHPDVANSYNNLGTTYTRKGEYDPAIKYHQKALEIRLKKFGLEHPEVANSYNNLGSAFIGKGEYNQAIDYTQKGLEIRLSKLGSDHLDVASSYNNLGLSYERKGEYDDAIEYHQKALDIRLSKLGSDHLDVANSYNNIGLTYNSISEYDNAIEYHQKALEIRLKKFGPGHPDVASSYGNLGVSYDRKGDYNHAIELHQKALEIRLKKLGSEHPDVASSYNNLGIGFSNKGDYDRGIEYYQKALEIRLKKFGSDNMNVAVSYNSLGIVYKNKGEYNRAIEYFQKSIEIRLKKFGPENQNLAIPYQNLGNTYDGKRQYDHAIEYYQKSLEIQLKKLDPENQDVASSYNNLGGSYFSKGEYTRAIEYHQKSLNIREKIFGSVHPLVAQSLLNLSSISGKMHRFSEGESYVIQSLKALHYDDTTDLEHISSVPILIQTLYTKATLYKYWHTYSSNLHHLRIAYESFQEASAAIAWQRRHLENPGSKIDLAKDVLKVYEGGISTCLLLYRLTDSLHYLYESFDYAEQSKSLLLYDALRQVDALRYANIPDSLLQREYDLRIDITYNENRRHAMLDSGISDTDTTVLAVAGKILGLNLEYEALVRHFETEYPNYYHLKYDFSAIGIEEVQAQLLHPEQTLLEYVVGDSSIFIFVIGKETFSTIEIKKKFPLEEWVDTLQTSMVERKVSTYCCLAHQLYQELILPVEDMLSEDLVIVPDGKLGYLPFDALLTQKPVQPSNFQSHAYLLRKHQISYSYSAALLQEMQNKQHIQLHPGAFLAFAPSFTGDTTLLTSRGLDLNKYGNLVPPLKYAKEEALELAQLLGGTAVVGDSATEDAFTKQAGQYAVVHLATHAKVNDQSGGYSFLAFAEIKDSLENDWLYVREIYNLTLNADMVTLSACETGIGHLQQGEGIISLARAFSYAGAKCIVNSLWSVDDKKTKDLMVGFYRNLKKGMSKNKALHQAKLDYLEENTNVNSHPFFWAGFIPVGDMSPIAF